MDTRAKLFLSLLFLANFANAEGFYVLAAGGISHTTFRDQSPEKVINDEVASANAGGFNITDSTNLDDENGAYKLQLGYQLNENFAIEGGYVDLGKTEFTYSITDSIDTQTGKISWDNKGWNLDGVLILPVNAGVSLFGKLGLIRAETKIKETDSIYGDSSDTVTKTRPNFGVGVAYNFYRGLSARLEAERFFRLAQSGSKMDIDLYSLGVSYHF